MSHVLCPTSHVPCPMSCVLCPVSHVPCPMSCVLRHVYYVLCPTYHVPCPVSRVPFPMGSTTFNDRHAQRLLSSTHCLLGRGREKGKGGRETSGERGKGKEAKGYRIKERQGRKSERGRREDRGTGERRGKGRTERDFVGLSPILTKPPPLVQTRPPPTTLPHDAISDHAAPNL